MVSNELHITLHSQYGGTKNRVVPLYSIFTFRLIQLVSLSNKNQQWHWTDGIIISTLHKDLSIHCCLPDISFQ